MFTPAGAVMNRVVKMSMTGRIVIGTADSILGGVTGVLQDVGKAVTGDFSASSPKKSDGQAEKETTFL